MVPAWSRLPDRRIQIEARWKHVAAIKQRGIGHCFRIKGYGLVKRSGMAANMPDRVTGPNDTTRGGGDVSSSSRMREGAARR